MPNAYTLQDLLEFLDHASDRGLMPAATAQALAVASRNVFAVLADDEKMDLTRLDVAAVVKRFTNKRAKDFSPSSLKEYGRRVTRAIDLFLRWREDPANFTIKTRATSSSRGKKANHEPADGFAGSRQLPDEIRPASQAAAYQSAIPVRPGLVVTLANIPYDLTKAEADRLANFVRMLAVE